MSENYDKERLLQLIDDVDLIPVDATSGPLGWVYFVICSDLHRCKIGFTKGDVSKRIKSLQTGSAGELVLLAKHPGTPATERQLHEKFAADHIHGEWFELTDELRAYLIRTLWVMTEFSIRNQHPLEAWMIAGVKLTIDNLGCCSEGLAEALDEASQA
jgi:hypothetical protein